MSPAIFVAPPSPPTAGSVIAACARFDSEFKVVEEAMRELFELFKLNDQHHRVLLKVVSLNRLYSTQIFAVADVAGHIFKNHAEIDASIAAGRLDVVDKIARVSIGGKIRYCFSFATKYCSWHNQDCYPIYDSRVEEYLWKLQKSSKSNFAGGLLLRRENLWDYPKFVEILRAFRSFYGLEEFNFKDLDKFMWMQAEAQGHKTSAVG